MIDLYIDDWTRYDVMKCSNFALLYEYSDMRPRGGLW